MKPITLFRCDASPTIGGGHVMRCLALAETMAEFGFSPVFLSAAGTAGTAPALAQSGYRVIDAEDDGSEAVLGARLDRACTAVVDHYGLDASHERRLGSCAESIIAFEDIPNRRHEADILVDPTPGRRASEYKGIVGDNTRVLAGAAYALIRRRWRSEPPAVVAAGRARVLVSLGATDPTNATARVLDAIAASGAAADVDVVLGPRAPHLEEVCARSGPTVMVHVDPANFPQLVSNAQLVVGAPGSSCFERAVLGVPSLLIPLADNQRDLAAAFASGGAAEVVPPGMLAEPELLGRVIAALLADRTRLDQMAASARVMCDGRGVQRLMCALAGAVPGRDGAKVRMRVAELADSAWLYALQCRPETRRFARSPGVPSRSEHDAWLGRTLADPDRLLAVAEDDNGPAGMLRLDRITPSVVPTFEVSIAVWPEMRGRGIGVATLALARRIAIGAELRATVLTGNAASHALFASAGYRRTGEESYLSVPQ